MGFFEKEKTSKDYLKEIAKSQKQQEKYIKGEQRARKMEAAASLINSIMPTAEDLNAEHARQEETRATRLAELEECKAKLQAFYDSFEFNLSDANDIEQKSMAIISWLDMVDRSFKDKKSEFKFYKDGGGGMQTIRVDDDNRSKEQTLIKKLTLAIERLRILGFDPTRLQYLEGKLKSYIAREEADINKKKDDRNKIVGYLKKGCLTSLGLFVLLIGIIIISSALEEDSDDLKNDVIELISRDKMDEACSKWMAYDGIKDQTFNETRDLIVEQLLENNQLNQAKNIEKHKQDRYYAKSDELIGNYMIQHGMYDEAQEYYGNDYRKYTEACINYLCKKGKYSEARKLVKRQSINASNQQEFINKMNTIINSYQ